MEIIIENLKIIKYEERHFNGVFNLLKRENWEEYTGNDAAYKAAIKNSAAYAAYYGGECCGLIRAINDSGISLYVSDLLVAEKYRNNKIGEMLLKALKRDNAEKDIYVLSDEDGYYIKKGLNKCGSVFKL